MHSLRFLFRALWFRRGFSLALLVVSVATLGAAALGPIYARAVGESTLQDSLTEAGTTAGLHFAKTVPLSTGELTALKHQVIAPGSQRGFPTSITGYYTPQVLTLGNSAGDAQVTGKLAWRQDFCQHLTLVSGVCPTARNEAVLSQQAVADNYFKTPIATIYAMDAGGTVVPLRIVGVYRPKNIQDPYWFGRPYFNHKYAQHGLDMIDTVFVSSATLPSLTGVDGEMDVDFPLQPSAVRVADLGAVRSSTVALRSRYTSPVTLTTSLPQVLDRTAVDRRALQRGTVLVTVQLGLLAWLVLFEVVADAVEARGNEIALSKLRGHNIWRTTRFGLGEPLVFLLLAIPLGMLLAYLLTRVMAALALVPGVPILIPWLAFGGAMIGFAGGALAAGLAAARTLRRPVLDQWRRTEQNVTRGHASLLLDVVVALAALGGFILLHTQNQKQPNSLTLLAPGLLIVFVALVGVRLLPVVCRWLAGRTRARRRVALFLASRQISRRRAGLRLAALLAVAVGLATFAASGESVARHNRTARAQAELGASQVATVVPTPGVDPVDAVRAADPDGTWAMAAATWLPFGGYTVVGTVLAVDTARLPDVAYRAAGGLSNTALTDALGTGAVPVLSFQGTTVRASISAAGLSKGITPDVQLNLRTSHNPYLNVEMQPLRDGTNTYTASVPCQQKCTFLGFTWDRPILATAPQSGTATLHSADYRDAAGWHGLDLRLNTSYAWHAAVAAGQASDSVAVTPGGVVDRFTNQNGGYGGIRYSISPTKLPVVVSPKAVVNAGNPSTPLAMTDRFGVTANYRIVKSTKVLPEQLDDGVLVDITAVRLALPGFDTECSWQVWLGSHAPADAVARLDRAGVNVQNVRTAAARLTVLSRQGPALSLLLLLVCAVAGSALAVGATAVSISATSRRRSYELAALQAIGVRRSSLRRSALAEQLLLMGTGVLLGVPAGVLGARLALPTIPEFSDTTPIAMHYLPSTSPILLLTAALLALLLTTAYIAARLLIRIAVPSRLREAE